MESTANLVKPVTWKSSDYLGLAGGVSQGHGDRNSHEIHTRHISIKLDAIKGEFAESPQDVDIRVSGVGHRWLNESWTWIQGKNQWLAD